MPPANGLPCPPHAVKHLPASRNVRLSAAFLALGLLAGPGCTTLKHTAVNQLGNALAESGSGFATDDDPELIRAAAPFSLKLIESLLAETPAHRGLRLAAASGFTQYAYVFLEQDADLMADQDFAGEYHGANGPVPVVRWRQDELLPAQQAFRTAVTEHGISWVDDFNAPDASGVGVIPMNLRDGVRMSTALTYLPLVRDRANLTIWPDIEVTRIVIERGRARGVEYPRDGRLQRVEGSRVILCAGALQSPTLLMRSGIGGARHLGEMGIDCTVELSGVGENLMDHQGTAVFMIPNEGLAPPDARVCQLGARYSSSAGTAPDDMWLSMWGAWELGAFPDMQAALGVPAISALIVGVHDPLSRGTVRLRSDDPLVRPQVDFKMATDPTDMSRLVDGLRLAIDLASSRAFAKSYRGIGLLDPTAVNDRVALETYITSTVGGWYHAAGTCRMGNDPDAGAVVDGHLKVYGVEALHVVDASVMPTVPRAPTNLSSIAIGERAAELLR